MAGVMNSIRLNFHPKIKLGNQYAYKRYKTNEPQMNEQNVARS